MSLWKRIKNAFKNWCAKMEKSNKEAFGDSKLDCCKLGREQSAQRR